MIEIARNSHLGTFAGFPNDHLFSLIRDGAGFIDEYVKEQIDRHVRPDSVCVDVGANLGYVSVYLAKRCRQLYSIEPQPTVFLQLCCNLFLNECLNVTPLNVAATSVETTLDFAAYQSGWVGTDDFSDYSKIRSIGSISLEASAAGKIPGKRLDQLITSRVDFIKIDAQGADIDVLFGAERILTEHRPVVVWEYEPDLSERNYGRTLADLTPYLERLGYVSETIYPNNFVIRPT